MAVQTESASRAGRFWLYAPFVLLLLVALAWTAGWFLVRQRVEAGLDGFLAREAQAGRQWTCRDRQVGGYPFRIEVSCAALDLKRPGMSASLGRVQAVAQVYQPRHVVAEVAGPLRATDGQVSVEGEWRLLETSVHMAPEGLRRASLVAEAPRLRVLGTPAGEVILASQALDAHLRPSPGRAAEGAYDIAAFARAAAIPGLDALVGGTEPADLRLDGTVTQAQGLGALPLAQELERWRQAGGAVRLEMLSLAKGPRRIEARGDLALDDLRRVRGQVQASAAGIETLVNTLTGGRVGGNLLGALFGGQRAGAQPGAAPALTPLPPLRLDEGRVFLGPFALPNLRLQPVY